jgi:hypothetical protein
MITKTNDGCMRIKRRTLNAYHACLTDFTLTSSVTSSFYLRFFWHTRLLFGIFFSRLRKPQRLVLSSSAERLICKIFSIGSSKQALKHN